MDLDPDLVSPGRGGASSLPAATGEAGTSGAGRVTRRSLRAAERAARSAAETPPDGEVALGGEVAPDGEAAQGGEVAQDDGRAAQDDGALEVGAPARDGGDAAPDGAARDGAAQDGAAVAHDGAATQPADEPRRRSRRRAGSVHAPADEGADDAEPGSVQVVDVDVVVVGAGQAGLSAAYHLHKAGLVPVGDRGWQTAAATFVVLDDAPAPGGAWQHRPPGMRVADAHGVHDLPGMPLLVPDPQESAARAVPYYFAQYEEAFGLHVQRPVTVTRVDDAPDDPATDGAERPLLVTSALVGDPTARVVWRTRGLVNASGTWRKPFWPAYPGRAAFRGRQVHSRDVRDPAELADGHVVVVGGGTSAVQLLLALAEVTTTTWVTRRPPAWRASELTPELGRAAVALVEERTRAGLPPGSIVSATGLPLTDAYRAGIASGVLRARPVFSRIVAEGVVWDDPVPPPVPVRPAPRAVAVGRSVGGPGAAIEAAPGQGTDLEHETGQVLEPGPEPALEAGLEPGLGGWADGPGLVEARTIVWATGYRPALDHLAPLRLRGPHGGVVMSGTRVAADPRVHLVGYGPSASTIGANRAGRDAVRELLATLHLR